MTAPKKSLGQHWLRDRDMLSHIADCAELRSDDTILEIGPGQGTLTSELLRRAKRVVAVELDSDLAKKLPGQFPGKNLEVVNQDILRFNLSTLPSGYVVVANVPYYITSKIIKMLLTSSNKPRSIVLLIQKEVAERVVATPGDMSLLSVSVQLYAQASLGQVVPASLFTPPPKVDSQVLIIKPRKTPQLQDIPESDFFRVVRAGFSAKRKKLRSSLSGGLGVSKPQAEQWCQRAQVSGDDRAESLGVSQWLRLAQEVSHD